MCKVYIYSFFSISFWQETETDFYSILNELINRDVDVVVTYGDPSYYSKTGFQPLSESVIQAPLNLSMPEGWLGQSLNQESIPTIHERPRCVEEFNDPIYW